MKNNLTNLVNKSKNTKPYNNLIITSDNYIKTDTFIADKGMLIYGNDSNINIKADPSVISGGTGPILQLYGNGGLNASVGINLDTFINRKSSATQILAIDNGSFSSDLVFKTAEESTNMNNANISSERMRIYANGNININNNLTING